MRETIRTEPFSPEHDALRQSIRRWVASEITPHVEAWEADGAVPREVITRAGELGFLGLAVDEADGGSGGDRWCAAVLGEELGRSGVGGLMQALSVQTDAATPPIAEHGTAEQRTRYLHPAVRGEEVAAIGIVEPRGGTDVAGIRTRAVRDGDGWVLDGVKTSVTNGTQADVITMVVRTSGQPGDDGGLSLFLVDTDLPGLTVTRAVDQMGMRTSGRAEVHLAGVRLPADALLGEEGRGAELIMRPLHGARLIGGFQALGTAEGLLDRAMAYARQREAFGRPIGTFQVQRHRLAEIATRIEAFKRLLHVAADGWDRGQPASLLVAQVELAGTRLACWVADEVMQLHGGLGYAEESGIPRLWRDVRLLRTSGGADEEQLEVIGELLEAGPSTTGPALPRLGAPDVDAAEWRVHVPRDAAATAPADRADAGVQPIWDGSHDVLRQAARSFVAAEITAHVEEWERDRDFPRTLFRTVGDAGFFGLLHDQRWGGSGADLAAQAVWVEELARCGAGGVAADLGAHNDLAALYIARAGDDTQHERWLRPSIAGEVVGALAITEPDAGSDVAATRTRAVRDGDDWVIDGAKTYITNGSWADHVVVLATTDPEARHGGKTLFVVEAGTPGFERRRLSMLGWHTSHTGELSFSGVRVPDANRLGELGSGFLHVMRNFAWERVSMSLGAVIAAETSLAGAMAHTRRRQASGRPTGASRAWRHTFADLATDIAQGRALTEHALRVTIAGGDTAAVEAAKSKRFTQRLAVRAADVALQVHDRAGPAQRWLRDARLGPIGGGTDEIMAEIIGRSMGF